MPFPVYGKKTDIPAGAEDVYEERDGQWHPKVEDTTALKTTLDKERTDRKAAEKAAKTAQEERDTAARERDALKAQVGDPETRTKELLRKFDEDLAAARAEGKAEIDKLTAELRGIKLDDAVKAEFVKQGGRPERADAALKLMRDRLDLADDRIVVKGADGKVTTSTLVDFLGKEFRKDMPELFKGTQASGGGAAGAQDAGGTTGGSLTAEDILQNPARAFEVANTEGAAGQ